MNAQKDFNLTCPIPIQDYPHITLAHGGGGKMTQQLIEKIFMPAFNNPFLKQQHDGAVFAAPGERLAFTTDSYVVNPVFFPGGDIGTLAVYGTVNDLAMCGAQPLYLSAGFILEEGFSTESLWKIVQSMKAAAERTGIQIVTGDTKVVDRGKGDGIFINTAGVGSIRHKQIIAPSQVKPGDAVLLSGDIGRHGMAIMATRENLKFESEIQSDCAPLNQAVAKLLESGMEVHGLRDLTRGGLASALCEFAEASGHQIKVTERNIPVLESVRGACEILGLDPLYVANEGRMIVFIPEKQADQALQILRNESPAGVLPQKIGFVKESQAGFVTLQTAIGTERVIDRLSGEQLPRIC